MFWWRKRQLHSKDSHTRKEAAETLGASGDLRAVEPLIVMLQDTDYSVRKAAVQALQQIGDTRAISPLITMLQNYSRPDDQEVAAKALDSLGWKHTDEVHHALRAVALREWKTAISIGLPA